MRRSSRSRLRSARSESSRRQPSIAASRRSGTKDAKNHKTAAAKTTRRNDTPRTCKRAPPHRARRRKIVMYRSNWKSAPASAPPRPRGSALFLLALRVVERLKKRGTEDGDGRHRGLLTLRGFLAVSLQLATVRLRLRARRRERDAFPGGVDSDDLHLDLLAGSEVAADRARRHTGLGVRDQARETGLEAHEHAEQRDALHLARRDGAFGMALLDALPRIRRRDLA